jgi:hypothetical protein
MKMIKRKNSTAAKIRLYLTKHPKAKASTVATMFKTNVQTVYTTKYEMKKSASLSNLAYEISKGRKQRMASATTKKLQLVHMSTSNQSIHDPVNHPAHYKVGGIETIDFIEAKGLGYHLGNVVKYITRADYKGNKVQDLKKAKWYLERAIEQHERAVEQRTA